MELESYTFCAKYLGVEGLIVMTGQINRILNLWKDIINILTGMELP
jgi:hypothetical protein